MLFVESSGPGPDGLVRKGVRHLLAIDVETRETEFLAELESSGPDGPLGHYTFDYAPGANCIVHHDLAGKNLFLLNLDTKKRGLLLHEPEGTIASPPSISTDGTRVVWWAMMPSIENRFFDNYTTVIFALDVDPAACAAKGPPRVVQAYPRRKGQTWTRERPGDGVHINHPQINPTDNDHICYSHEMLGSKPDGTPDRCRLWETRVDGGGNRPLVPQPAGLDFTHEVIAPDGKSLIFPYMHGVGQVFFGTLERRSIYYNPHLCPGHLTVSPDMKWIAGDTWGAWKNPEGKVFQTIMMFDVATRKFANLCWIPRSKGHPGHPHPNFSPDGRRIAFTHLDDGGHTQVAFIDVARVQAHWDDVAEGAGALASPKWR
jgi:hypothetical protein